MKKIILEGYILVPDVDMQNVLQELPNHIRLTQEESGCLQFSVAQDEINKSQFNVYEIFVDEESFKSHQARVKNSKWGDVSINVERHYTVTGL